MGSGKTTVGKSLSEMTHIPFIDLDEEINKHTGQSIADIFKHNGEEFFRLKETEILKKITSTNESFIISTGGGTPCFHQNMDWMLENGKVVWLKASIQIVYERIETYSHRPMIAGASGTSLKNFIRQHLRERRPFYKRAHFAVWSVEDPLTVATRIRKKLNPSIQ